MRAQRTHTAARRRRCGRVCARKNFRQTARAVQNDAHNARAPLAAILRRAVFRARKRVFGMRHVPRLHAHRHRLFPVAAPKALANDRLLTTSPHSRPAKNRPSEHQPSDFFIIFNRIFTRGVLSKRTTPPDRCRTNVLTPRPPSFRRR